MPASTRPWSDINSILIRFFSLDGFKDLRLLKESSKIESRCISIGWSKLKTEFRSILINLSESIRLLEKEKKMVKNNIIYINYA
jgi:hypothetical protein